MPSSHRSCAESPSVSQEPGQAHSTDRTAMSGHSAVSVGHQAATGCPAAHHQTPHGAWETPMETGALCPSPVAVRAGAAPAARRGEHRAMGAAGGQGGRSGRGPGRCCSQLGSADSPQVPVPGLSPSTGRWDLPSSPQPRRQLLWLFIPIREGTHHQATLKHNSSPGTGHIPLLDTSLQHGCRPGQRSQGQDDLAAPRPKSSVAPSPRRLWGHWHHA